jgi:DNA-binding NtrC family response regulator
MGTILLVDDDALQACLRKSVLERRFKNVQNVQRVGDAAEALCLVEQPQFARDLGLVITGHHTAGIGGPAFVAELHERMPGLQVLVIGGAGEKLSDYPGDDVCFLPKPSSTDELLALAGQMLTGAARPMA